MNADCDIETATEKRFMKNASGREAFFIRHRYYLKGCAEKCTEKKADS